MDFGMFPVAPMIIALLIPIFYSLSKRRKELRSILMITICSIAVIVLYPLVSWLSGVIPYLGYTIGKFILFVIFPAITVLYIERWKVRNVFRNFGVRREGLPKSVLYGIIAAIITIIITIFVSTTSQFDAAFRSIMFFESFTEEFFFRGFLFIYLISKTNTKVAYATSILGFILIHPQHFTRLFLISTIAQSILLTVVAHKTKNMIGPWISHGLNRFFPTLIRSVLGM